jgi:hypothetical protein
MPAGKQHEGIYTYILKSANTIIINVPIFAPQQGWAQALGEALNPKP